jgi:chromosome segregation ATPase
MVLGLGIKQRPKGSELMRRKQILVLIFLVIGIARAVYAQDYTDDTGRDTGVKLRPGMEIIRENGVNIVVPEGGRVYKETAGYSRIESATEYSARKFKDMEERLKKIEEKQQAIMERLEEIESAPKELTAELEEIKVQFEEVLNEQGVLMERIEYSEGAAKDAAGKFEEVEERFEGLDESQQVLEGKMERLESSMKKKKKAGSRP